MEHSSWSLASNARNKMVTKIMDTLQKHMPDRGPEGMDDLKKIALRFEEKIYSAAADQQDYLRRISTKMISLETKNQVSQGNTLPIISAGSSQKPPDPGPMISSQLRNPSQTLANDFPLTGQSQLQQQLQQNLPNSMNAGGMQSAAPLASALSPVSSLPQSTGGQCFGTQNSILNSTGQGLAQNVLLANAQRQMQTRQQQHQQQVIQQQQSQVQQQILQHTQAILKQRIQQQSQHGPSMLQQQQQHFQQPQQQFQHQQQHIQNQQLVQQNQLPMSQQSILQQLQSPSLQSTQQSLMQHSQSSVLQSAQQAVQQQTQPSTLQQTSPSLLQKHQQSVVRHQQPQQAVTQQPSILQQQPPSLTNVSDMQQQQQQQQLQQLRQAKNAQHQQTQQASSSLLPSQSEQLQQQPQQQQLLSRLQPQPQQLQQQQPVLLQPNLTQQELQPRLHTSSVLLQQQQQNSIEQQKQLLQFQSRMMSDAATTNMDSSAQTGQTTVVEMQERIYQRMQLLKEMYLPELQELYQKLHIRSQQTMPRDQLVKLQQYKDSVNGFIRIIQHPRSNILTTKEEKVDAFELKIKTILSQARLRRPALQQEGQQQIPLQAGIQVQSFQQSQLQTPQMQQDKHVNHLQQMNSQVPMTSMQSNTVPPIQHSSTQMLLQSGLQTSQQNIRTAMQSVGNLNSTQGSGLATFQQSSFSSLQHNNNSYALQQNNSAIQQNSINSLQQSGISTLQNNMNPVQSNVNALNHHQAIKQQEMLQLQAHRKIMLSQQQQQQQQPLHESQQFRQPHLQQLQQKQQQAAHLQAQFQAQQMPQLPQINDMNNDVNLKLKQTATLKQTLMQQNHSSAQRTVYPQQQQQLQFKTGTSLSVSSSPLLSTASPQVSQQSSPQIGQQNLVTSSVQVQFPKIGTPLQQMTSEDAEKQSSALSSISNVGCGQGAQQTATAIAIGAPGISASPLLDGFSPTHSHNVVNQEQTISAGLLIEDKSSTEEPPFERLIKVINKMSHKALASAVNDIGSVVSLMDRMAGSAPGNGSRAAVGEDLAAMTKCRLQARNLMSQDGNAATKKMKRRMNSIPLSTVSSGGTVTNSFQQYNNEESLEIKSTATSRIKRPRLEMSHVLQDELQEIYQQLIDTAVEISEDDDAAAALAAEGRDGVVLKCYYNAKALSPNMKSGHRSSQMTPISPLCLLIPADYPNSSPVLLDKAPTGSCKEYVDLSSKARAKFHAAVRTLPQPMSILALARTWDVSARSTVVEYAQQSGGGSFSSCFGTWESCTNA